MPAPNHDSFDPTEGARLADQLESRQLPLLDFDRLRTWLGEACEQFQQIARQAEDHQRLAQSVRQTEHELNLFRDDYQARIAGMLKAIAIADSSHSRQDSLAEIIDSLAAMSALELISCYRKTSAILRDHFPNSLSPLKP
ncbi:MAG: hypothetical protein IPH75_13505 [bacterium]|nr:hypothetical protein [bacterium]